MHAGMSPHVMLLTRIGKEVRLGTRLDAGIEERETMLWHNGIVVVARNDLQTAFQILGLADERRFGIALWIRLRGVHIALAVHHLVPLPVNDGTTSYSYLENVGVGSHERDGHKSSERPARNKSKIKKL